MESEQGGVIRLNGGRKIISERLFDRIGEGFGKISGLAILVMVLLVTFNAFSRKLLKWPIPGFYELVGMIGAVFYGLGMVYAAYKGQHIMMDMVLRCLSAKLRQLFEGIIRVAIIIFCAIFSYAGGSVALDMWNRQTEELRIPELPFRLVVVIGLIFLGLILLFGSQNERKNLENE